MLARLDESRDLEMKREAEKGSWHPTASDPLEEEHCRLPLRVQQEISGRPVGFEIRSIP
jgi:hypothetical protein